jgi:hypothetical protein
LLAGDCLVSAGASSAIIDATLKLEFMNGLAQNLAPGLLTMILLRSFEDAADAVTASVLRPRVPVVINKNDVIHAEPGFPEGVWPRY